MRNGAHWIKHLQDSWNKYGESNFKFEILHICVPEECLTWEQHYIDKFRSYDRKVGYNLSPTAGSRLGDKHSPEVLAKISAAGRGRKHSPESLAKIVASNTGKKRTEEFGKQVRLRQLGKKATTITKLKMSIAQKRSWTPERRQQWSAQRRGRKLSPEHVKKIADSNRGKKWGEESKERMRVSWEQRRGQWLCPKCRKLFDRPRLETGVLCQSKYCPNCKPPHHGGFYKHNQKVSNED